MKYDPLISGFDDLAAALRLAPELSRRNKLAEQERADRSAREEAALRRSLMLDNERRKDKEYDRKFEREKLDRMHPVGGKPQTESSKLAPPALLKDVDERIQNKLLAEGKLVKDEASGRLLPAPERKQYDEKGKEIAPIPGADPVEIEKALSTARVAANINPRTLQMLGPNEYAIEWDGPPTREQRLAKELNVQVPVEGKNAGYVPDGGQNEANRRFSGTMTIPNTQEPSANGLDSSGKPTAEQQLAKDIGIESPPLPSASGPGGFWRYGNDAQSNASKKTEQTQPKTGDKGPKTKELIPVLMNKGDARHAETMKKLKRWRDGIDSNGQPAPYLKEWYNEVYRELQAMAQKEGGG